MSLADALYWENEMNPKPVVSLWKNPLEEMPDINKQDPDIAYRQVSDTVLVKMKKASFDTKPYVALAKYTRTDYGDGLASHYQWHVEHHTGNWDNQIIGWHPIPDLGE